jgi:hypothetical protein
MFILVNHRRTSKRIDNCRLLARHAGRRIALTLAAMLLTLSLAKIANAQAGPISEQSKIEEAKQADQLLGKLVEQALTIQEGVGRKRVLIQNQVLTYDLRPEPYTALVSRPDRLTVPLEVSIRAAVLTRDFRAALPSEIFWVQPLEQVQALTSRIVQAAYDTASDDEWRLKLDAYQRETETDFKAVETGLLEYANRSKLNVVNTRGSSDGYPVEIRIEPPKARVRYVPFLDYLRSQYFHKSLDDEWNDLSAGTNILIGRYHYRAEWPKSLNGPEEGNFEVHGKVTITFRPKEN